MTERENAELAAGKQASMRPRLIAVGDGGRLCRDDDRHVRFNEATAYCRG